LCCAALIIAAGAFVSLLSSPALAQAAARTPVIDSAPPHVNYEGGGTIAGHLEGGVAGDEVALQRRAGDSWATRTSKVIDEAGKVSFTVDGLRRTGSFRLVYVDPTTDAETASDPVRITVSPHLTFHLSPDHVMQGRTVTAYGRVTAGPGRWLAIQQRVAGSWRTIDTVYQHDGRYALRFEAHRIGARRLRAVFRGDDLNSPAKSRSPLRVYDPALATWYGPGFWGHGTACGQTLRSDTLGVAHRSLPCGTEVAVLYQGRTLIVRVIDRGPYSRADWDLTQATAERLGFSGTDTIGVDPVS
jgi:hypothetical protein